MSNYFLYAEDDRDDIDILQEMMRKHQYPKRLISVSNGYLLLQYLQQIKRGDAYPCLIILEAKLPRLNGMETLQLLKTDDLYRLIPVIVFSTRLCTADKLLCEELGAEIVEKPTTYSTWQNVLSQFYTYSDD